jgi:hypothetical protein
MIAAISDILKRLDKIEALVKAMTEAKQGAKPRP